MMVLLTVIKKTTQKDVTAAAAFIYITHLRYYIHVLLGYSGIP
jgi:hypothetical protein